MIVVNPRNHGVKNAIFRLPFAIFTTLVSVTFFWFRLGGDSTVGSERSREVGLHKVPLVVFWYNQPELRYFDRPK